MQEGKIQKVRQTGSIYYTSDAYIINSIPKTSLLQELILIFSTSRSNLNALKTILRGTLTFPVGFVDFRGLLLSRLVSIIFFSPVYNQSTF